ncbi:MAG: oligosaccharide flippase family protein, partial [Tepidisphaeraceae bacterium]
MDSLAIEPTPPELSLGHTAARGFAWLLMNTVTIKVVTLIQTIVLGWRVTRDDYGLVGDTLTVGGLAAIIGTIAMDDLLVQRQKDFRRWATPGFWMSLTLGLVAAGAMVAIAPLGAKVYHSRRLIGLVIVAAVAVPLQNLSYVPVALLRTKLRYRTLAGISWGQSLLQALLTILFAWLRWGAYSIIVA